MHVHSTTTPIDRLAKQKRLKEIVSGLGPDATPAQIRQEAYRVGFGTVNAAMLVKVRNELWPDREKHPGGRVRGSPATKLTLPPGGRTLPLSGILDSRRVMARVATHKTCSKCKQNLPVERFGKRAGDADLYRPACRDCLNKMRAERQLTVNMARYGLTASDYWTMRERQGGVCAICRKPGKVKSNGHQPLCVDHCHRTGKLRGLLCDRCNLGIGNFDDDVNRFQAVIAYLQAHESPESNERR